jgi:predicted nucleic acid-binding protein
LNLIVVDASVAVRWLVQLPGHGEARALFGHQNRLLAPEFLPAEVGSALTKLVRAKALTRKEGLEAFDDFFRAPVRLSPVQQDSRQAMAMALRFGQSCYDCLYLALAEREGGTFATADGRFWKAMRGTTFERHLMLIGPLKAD